MASFSENVKDELFKALPDKPCCMLSELTAITQQLGTLVLRGGGKLLVRYQTASNQMAKRILILLKRRLHIVPQIVYRDEKAFGPHRCFILIVQEGDARKLLTALKMLTVDETGVTFHRLPRNTMSRRCCQRSYIRAMFLTCGSVRDPSAGYTAEFTFLDEERSVSLKRLMDSQSVSYSARQRKGRYVVYIPSGEGVADLLALINAPLSRLAFEDQRILRVSGARASRAINCDSANLNRQLTSAEKQTGLIRALLASPLSESLSPSLMQTAKLRLQHPEASLEELGTFFSPPLTKSGVYHRLQKLESKAKDIPAVR